MKALARYDSLKASHPWAVCFIQVGDFWETFRDDAWTSAEVANLVLTSRPSVAAGVYMAGVPYHAADACFAKLVQAGYSVMTQDTDGALKGVFTVTAP